MKYHNKLSDIFENNVFVCLPQSAQVSWITFVNYEKSKYFNKERSIVIHPNAINDINTEELNLYERTKTIMLKDIRYTLNKLTKLMESQKNQQLKEKYYMLVNSLSKSYDQVLNILDKNINHASLNKINRLGVYDEKILQLSEDERKDLVIESFFSNTNYINLLKSNVMKLLVIAIVFLITIIVSKH